MSADIQPGVEFQALPLEMIIATPLTAAVKAQRAAADATAAFINGFLIGDGTGPKKPATIDLTVERTSAPGGGGGGGGTNAITVHAPLLSIVPIPHLRIDSLTVNFKYAVSQVYVDKEQTRRSLDLTVKTGGVLSPWVEASLKGSLESTSSTENTVNRSGTLDITVRASEAPMPEGLNRLLAMLAKGVEG